MQFSPDFLHMFAATAILLDKDPSLWCVSSWNDNGLLKDLDWDPKRMVSCSSAWLHIHKPFCPDPVLRPDFRRQKHVPSTLSIWTPEVLLICMMLHAHMLRLIRPLCFCLGRLLPSHDTEHRLSTWLSQTLLPSAT